MFIADKITCSAFEVLATFKIRGLRNRIVHNYFGINYKIIWSVKEEDLPDLITQIKLLLNEL